MTSKARGPGEVKSPCTAQTNMNNNPSQTSIQRRWRKLNKRECAWLTGLVLFAFTALIAWKPLRHELVMSLILRSDAPAPEVLSGIIKETDDPKSLLLRLWQTQRIAHRHFVLSYLGRIVDSESNLFRAMEPVVLEAVGDPDIETRELAFAALARTKHSQLRQLALAQLEDVDPAARVLGLQNLRSVATSNDVPITMRLLNDSEPRVVVAAALVLRQATGQDFGIRSSHALPQFTGSGTNAPSPPDLNAISQGVQRWQGWWKEHQAKYPAALQPLRISSQPQRLATSDFTLEDSNGKPVRLSDYRGKTVLLTFWSLDAPASLNDAPALVALQHQNPDGVAVLGICVPPASCDEDDEPAPGHAHHHHDMAMNMKMPMNETLSPAEAAVQTRALVQKTALEHEINYPVLLDLKGTVGRRFDVENLPTYVLIDASGMIRRRFVGTRTRPALEAMVGEISKKKTARTTMP
jgi:peroxiredoxin